MPRAIVDSTDMRRLAGRLEQLSDEYQYLYERELYGRVSEKIRKAYKGVDADAMIHGLEEFHNDFARLKRTIDQYAAHLRRAAAKYDDMQEELACQAAQLSKDV